MVGNVPCGLQAPQALAQSEVIHVVVDVGSSSWRRDQSQGLRPQYYDLQPKVPRSRSLLPVTQCHGTAFTPTSLSLLPVATCLISAGSGVA